ncbi:MAG: glucose-6-phosphate dehydrogenase, partial [Massilia sp.]|nr:glucose-6-phosphate dehydrogenase [Massilia sp.]
MALSDFDLVFFGGSGDLAMRKLLPAMYARDVCNDLPPTARIICVGRESLSQDAFIEMVETNAKPHVKESVDATAW